MISLIFFLISQSNLAESLYSNSYYGLTTIEYKRLFYFYPQLYTDKNLRLHYATSLLKCNSIKGIAEFQKIAEDFPDIGPRTKLTMAKYYIRVEYYSEAANILSETDEKKLLGYVYLLNNNLYDARNNFDLIGEYGLVGEINNYLKKPKKSITTATLLSFVCPGAGEIYAGNIKSGVIDFLLNFGTGFLFYNAVKEKRYIDAGLIFGFLFNRFYIGSMRNAQKFAYEWNEENRKEWLENLKNKYLREVAIDE